VNMSTGPGLGPRAAHVGLDFDRDGRVLGAGFPGCRVLPPGLGDAVG
jgi:hypothetical protein